MTDFSHLDAIQQRLRIMRDYLANAKNEHEREWYAHRVAMIEREEVAEYKFLGIEPHPASLDALMSDDELLAELLED